jgi:hypothetical protein
VQFEIYASPADELHPSPEDWRTFKVHTGRVSCKTPDNDDASDDPLVIIVPASTEKYYVWLECKVFASEYVEPVVDEVTIKHGTDPTSEGWTDFPDQTPGESDPITYRQIIGTIQTGSETAADDDFRRVTIDQNVRSHLTAGFLVDHVFQDGDALVVWKKMIMFGPDNFVECPEAQKMTSSAESASPGSSQSPSSGQQQSQPGSRSSLSSSSSPSSSSESVSDSSSSLSSSNPYSDYSVLPSSSEKTAIVPFRPRRGRVQYVGLFCAEMPEARFEDVVVVKLGRRLRARVKLNPIFRAVCAPRSIAVCAAVPSIPAVVGARIARGWIVVERAAMLKPAALSVTLRLTGIRKGFAGRRFPRFTRGQMLANDAFYAGARRKPTPPLRVETKIITGPRR